MKFNVGGIEYKVEEVEDLASAYGFWGRVYYGKSLIHVDKYLSLDRKKQTIIHELTHALLDEAGYKDQSEMEELVERLSIVLYQFIKCNDLSHFKEGGDKK